MNDVSFTVADGQVLGLLGENGAGKSTLMNIITGCLAPTGGTVKIDGYDIYDGHREAKRRLGYLPEVAPLYDEMTVRAYLKFVCGIREVVSRDIPGHILDIAGLTGISSILQRRIGNLSKGLRQRVGIAQALCASPGLIILDEPTIGLDPAQTIEFRALIKKLSGKHTIIISSHILSQIQAVADRNIILHKGNMIYDSAAAPGDGLRRLRLHARCGADQLMNLLRTLPSIQHVSRLSADGEGTAGAELTCRQGADAEGEIFSLLSRLNTPILRLSPVQDSL